MKFWITLLFFVQPASGASSLLINGAGATFPYILYSKWLSEYSKEHPSIRINYRSIGSSGGIRQLIKGTLDFGASDVPMNAEEIKLSPRPIVQIPTALSAVVLTYNLPSVGKKTILMTAEMIKKIMEGRIKKWNDPRLTALNPHLSKVNKDIIVIYRADGSGTTAVFTEYLAGAGWTGGRGKSVNWPVGVGGKGNEGVTSLVQKMEGAFAYAGMSYALNRKLPVVHIQNKSGAFIKPSFDSIKSAAKTGMAKNKSYLKSIVSSGGKKDYPISSLTYLLVYQKMKKEKGRIIVDFLNWALTKGQSYAGPLFYTSLPQNIIQKASLEIKKIKLENDKTK